MTICEVSPDWKSEYPDPKSTDKNLGLTNGGIKNGDLAQMMCLPLKHEARVQSPECMKRKKSKDGTGLLSQWWEAQTGRNWDSLTDQPGLTMEPQPSEKPTLKKTR